MIWGETGTRYGATRLQVASVGWLWSRYEIKELHNGDCVGADAQLYWLVNSLLIPDIVIHPPINDRHRAGCGFDDLLRSTATKVTFREPKGYHARDRDVVDESDVMVGLPKKPWEEDHGGTWYTINYAREQEKPLAIVWPNGLISYERWNLEQL